MWPTLMEPSRRRLYVYRKVFFGGLNCIVNIEKQLVQGVYCLIPVSSFFLNALRMTNIPFGAYICILGDKIERCAGNLARKTRKKGPRCWPGLTNRRVLLLDSSKIIRKNCLKKSFIPLFCSLKRNNTKIPINFKNYATKT
jgi:hypothetical protein